MTDPTVFWPVLLGGGILAAGIITSRRELATATSRDAFGLAVLGPTFIAAAIAAFAGEHFTIAASIAQLIPKWIPGRLFIAYFVGAAHLAAALSFVARRYVRWSAACLALMFALFVLLMDLPGAIANPGSRMGWVLAARETTFSIGALSLFALAIRDRSPRTTVRIAAISRIWMAGVLVYYGIDHVLHPQYTPGVPSKALTQAWVPAPHALTYGFGVLLIVFGVAMLAGKFASEAAALGGVLMMMLVAGLYVPQFVLADGAAARLVGINYVFDTMLFAGTLLVIGRAIRSAADAQAAVVLPASAGYERSSESSSRIAAS